MGKLQITPTLFRPFIKFTPLFDFSLCCLSRENFNSDSNFPGKNNILTLCYSSPSQVAIFSFILFIRFLHVIVLLTIIITFYAFNNFSFPRICFLSLFGFIHLFGNASEMKISRKIYFFMQIFSSTIFSLFSFVSVSAL